MDRVAARYGALPPDVVRLPPAQFVAALQGAREDQREAYRQAAFPVWLKAGKKAGSWPEFLRKLRLSSKAPAQQSRRKRSDVDVESIYQQAEEIKARHQKRG